MTRRSPVVHLGAALCGVVLLVLGLALIGIGTSRYVDLWTYSSGRAFHVSSFVLTIVLWAVGVAALLVAVVSGLRSSAGLLMGLPVAALSIVVGAFPSELVEVAYGTLHLPVGTIDEIIFAVVDLVALTLGGLGLALVLSRRAARRPPAPARARRTVGRVVANVLVLLVGSLLGQFYVYSAQSTRVLMSIGKYPESASTVAPVVGAVIVGVALVLVLMTARWAPTAPFVQGVVLVVAGIWAVAPRHVITSLTSNEGDVSMTFFHLGIPLGLVLVVGSLVLHRVGRYTPEGSRGGSVVA